MQKTTIPNNNGLLYKLYENNGLFGKPLITKIISSPNLKVPDTASFSAELTGTITFQQKKHITIFNVISQKQRMRFYG